MGFWLLITGVGMGGSTPTVEEISLQYITIFGPSATYRTIEGTDRTYNQLIGPSQQYLDLG